MGITYNQSSYTYNQSGWTYNQLTVSGDQTIGMGCKISAPGSQTIQLKARINPTFTMRAKIRAQTYRAINMKTFVVWREGWPIIDPSDPGYVNFTPTQLIWKARIVNNSIVTTRSGLINAHISPKHISTTSIQAHIGPCSRLSIQANVQPRIRSSIATISFDISSVLNSTAALTFSVSGLFSTQTVGMGAMIARQVTKKALIHFTIPATPTTGNLDTITASASPLSNAQLGIGAYIS
jgi:hypothetical protein